MLISFPAAVRVMASACLLLLGPAQVASAQAAADKAAPKTPKPAKPIPPEALKDPEAISAPRRESFELTVNQRDRFKQYLPKTFVKLSNREPVHMVALGDSIVDMFNAGAEESGDYLRGYSAMFGKELARQFYYTGDLRVVRPNPKKLSKDRPYLGPEITFRSLGRGGKMMLHAMQALSTFGYESYPDLVLCSFGINDATVGVNPADYVQALRQVIAFVQSKGSEMILLGSTVTVEDPPEESMAANRKFVDTMREIANEKGIFFVDLGDLDSLVEVPKTVKEPALVFDEVVKQYRRFFNQGEQQDFVHPKAELQALLGKRIFQELIDGPISSPWQISPGTAVMKNADQFDLTFQIKNTSKEDETLATLPMVTSGWRPMEAQPEVTIPKGKTATLKMTYAKQPDPRAERFNPMPSHEPLLRLPIFLHGGGITRIEDVRATIQPATVLWNLTTLFNQEKAFSLDASLMNTSGKVLDCLWEAEWNGQKRKGAVSIPADQRRPLDLTFDLPDANAPFRNRSLINLKVKAGDVELTFVRTLEIARNVGLKMPIPLTPSNAPQQPPEMGDLGDRKPGVVLKVDADKGALYLTYEISGIEIEDLPTGKPGAFGWNLNIDARSYGQRLTFGSTDSLRLVGGMAADGPYKIVVPQPWAFGTGYAAMFDEAQVKTQLASSPTGTRRFTVTLPRNYFYLHEWAIGNGNSQLGINSAIQFWENSKDGGAGGYVFEKAFSLLTNDLPRDDVDALGVLELTDKPTNRWTVIPN